jgi:hypothetical protein
MSTIKGVIYIEQGVELASRVLTNIKKEGTKNSLGLFSLLLLSLLLLISRVLKASSKSLIISPLKSVIYCL